MTDRDQQKTNRAADAVMPGAGPLSSSFAGYLIALVAVLLSWLLRLGLTALFGDGLPTYTTFYPAVIVATLLGGWGPGLLATGLVSSSVVYGLLPPAGFAVMKTIDMVGLLLFLAMCLLIIAVTQRYRQSRVKAAAFDSEVASRAERVRSALALQQSEERYRQLVEQATDGIFVADAEGRYVDVNAAGAQMLGYSRDEILARRLGDFICPEEAVRITQELGRLADRAVVISEWHLRRKDGSTFCGEVAGWRLPDGRLLGILRDISASRRLEAERQQERALLDSVMAGTDIMLVYLDPQFNFVWVNQAYANACRMERQSMVGKNHFVLYPDAENEATFCRVRSTGQAVFYKDKPFEFPDQPERGVTYWDWSLAPDKNALGQVVGLVFSLRETTHYVRAQLAVRESEERFAALADAAPVFIWMAGPDKVCSWFNQQWLNFTGRSMAQELNNGWAEAVHPDDIEHCLEIYESSFDRRESFTMDYRLRSASGEYRWLSDKAAPYYSPDGQFLGYIGTCTDITERQLAEDALIAAQAFAHGTIDAISASLCVLDKTGRILAVNQAWRDFYDQNHPHPEGLNYAIGSNYLAICDGANMPFPTGAESMATGIRQVIAGERSRFTYEYPCHSPALERWFVATVTRFHGDSGNVVVAHENVTERKKAEDAVKAATAEAEQANDAKSRFLAAASHDLRQPLSALSIYVGVLKNKVAPVDAPLLDNMANCLDSLSELLTDLLDISKLDAGVVTPVPSEFSVADLLANMVAVHEPEALLKGLRLRAVASSLHARTDPVLFRRMIGNLIANAVRYTERGGVVVGCRRHQGKYWIEVWDSGIGIPEDKTADVFEEFRQLDNDARQRGSGLGLAIVA
ncbi:MAG TPA: PAS domain S-box protein, partial [Azonexus sp.]|nr:PAS domain S-box protein [Azonexus sp.]